MSAAVSRWDRRLDRLAEQMPSAEGLLAVFLQVRRNPALLRDVPAAVRHDLTRLRLGMGMVVILNAARQATVLHERLTVPFEGLLALLPFEPCAAEVTVLREQYLEAKREVGTPVRVSAEAA